MGPLHLAPHSKRAAAKACSSNGQMHCRKNRFCRSITVFAGLKQAGRSSEPPYMYMEPKLDLKATDIRKIGLCQENQHSLTTRINKTRRCFGITITPWALTDLTSTLVFWERLLSVTAARTLSIFPTESTKSRWSST